MRISTDWTFDLVLHKTAAMCLCGIKLVKIFLNAYVCTHIFFFKA